MAEVTHRTQQYRLRAGTPMPVAGVGFGRFVLHTFMAEMSDVDMITCTQSLPASEEFRGQGGNLVSANFSRMNIAGGDYFQGKKVYNHTYVEETELGFNF